jgi:hypothetical protein
MALYCVLVPYPVPGYRTARIHRVMGTQTAPGVICGERCEQPSARSTRGNTGTRVGPNGAIGRITYRLDPRVGPLATGTAPGMQTAWGSCVALGARGGTRGGLNCLTHALPRCLPTPIEEADGKGYGVIAGWRGPPRPPLRASVNLVPLLWTGVRLHPSA